MQVANLELCEQLYELSGWRDTHFSWRSQNKQEPRVIDIMPNIESDIPAYDLGCLLRKLPERTGNISDTVILGRATDNKGWSCIYQVFVRIADTPEDAACKLVIELFKSNILKRKGSNMLHYKIRSTNVAAV